MDYGVGNLASIKNMFKKINVESIISSKKSDILQAEKLILPGVGAFDTCSQKLAESDLLPSLNQRVLIDKVPVLGICVGLQLLLERSEEGVLPGLGWIKGSIVKFNAAKMTPELKIPHMGWTDVTAVKGSKLFDGMYESPRFYFVHSYHPSVMNEEDALVQATYGYPFTAGVERGNIMGVQFHPEKSHKFGMKLLENFARL